MTRFTLGYVRGETPAHRWDPRAKLVFFLGYAGTLATAHSLASLSMLSLVAALASLLSRVHPFAIWKNVRGILVFSIIIGCVQIITKGGFFGAASFTLKAVSFITLATLFIATTPPAKLMDGLRSLLSPLVRVRISTEDFIFMLMLGFIYIPLLAEEMDRIAMAQRARGNQPAAWNLLIRGANAFGMLLPILSSTLRRADTLATALDARGYQAGKRMSGAGLPPFCVTDGVIIAAAFCLPSALLL